jgi:tRNA A37 methylthiotransferase MiaB
VFPYSPRPGTPAANWSDSLPKAERTARAARLRNFAESRKRAFLKSLATLPQLTVLVESDENNGVCEYYAQCQVRGQGLRPGTLVVMRPEGVRDGRLVGVAVAGGQA